jgi:hypothetical protein
MVEGWALVRLMRAHKSGDDEKRTRARSRWSMTARTRGSRAESMKRAARDGGNEWRARIREQGQSTGVWVAPPGLRVTSSS